MYILYQTKHSILKRWYLFTFPLFPKSIWCLVKSKSEISLLNEAIRTFIGHFIPKVSYSWQLGCRTTITPLSFLQQIPYYQLLDTLNIKYTSDVAYTEGWGGWVAAQSVDSLTILCLHNLMLVIYNLVCTLRQGSDRCLCMSCLQIR